jgi:cell division protein FtsB
MDVNPADLVFLHASLAATIRQLNAQIEELQAEIAQLRDERADK